MATPRPATLFGTGKVEELKALIAAERDRARHHRPSGVGHSAAQPGARLERQGARPHRPDPRDLRPPRPHQGRPAAGRAGASVVSEEPPRADVDPLGAPARRLRLPRRPRRSADRARPAHDRRAHHRHPQGSRGRRAHARTAPARSRGACPIRSSPSSATRTPASRRCSTASPAPTCSPSTSCSPRSIRPCARCACKSGRRIILSDTVGFISDLPTMLVAAFRATLEEVIEADLILHVRDISHPETDSQARDVEAVLTDLGIDTVSATAAILEVWNKIDLLSPVTREEAMSAARWPERPPALVSADDGRGDRDAARRHRCAPRARRRRRRSGHSRRTKAASSTGFTRRPRSSRGARSTAARCEPGSALPAEKKERLAGPGPPRRCRLDAGADLTLRHVHIAGSKTKPTPTPNFRS